MTDIHHGVGHVYGIRNMTNGLMYVGASKHLRIRIAQHYRLLKQGEHPEPKLQKAWNEDGRSAFEVVIIERVPLTTHRYGLDANLRDAEDRWLANLAVRGLVYNRTIPSESASRVFAATVREVQPDDLMGRADA